MGVLAHKDCSSEASCTLQKMISGKQRRTAERADAHCVISSHHIPCRQVPVQPKALASRPLPLASRCNPERWPLPPIHLKIAVTLLMLSQHLLQGQSFQLADGDDSSHRAKHLRRAFGDMTANSHQLASALSLPRHCFASRLLASGTPLRDKPFLSF